ncbi:MAG: hypothetical protein ACQEP1_06760, partial [Nanobdellota archaeon]
MTYSREYLEAILKEDIDNTNKQRISIFAGHLPVRYQYYSEEEKEEIAKEQGRKARDIPKGEASYDMNRWGHFSKETFELGCILAKYAKENGKEAQLLVV